MKPLFNIIVILFLSVLTVNAQQKLEKASKSIDVDKDVTIDLNTSFVNIEFESWNKNVLEIEAYVESDKLSKEDLKRALKEWNLAVEGHGDHVSITTKGALSSWAWSSEFEDLNSLGNDLWVEIAEMPEMPELPEFPEIPEIPVIPNDLLGSLNIPNLPDLPELPEGVTSIDFDTDEYEERGEAYLDDWSKDFDKEYGDGYAEKMKAWARAFVESDFEGKMEKWGEKFGEEFGENFGKKMEAWGEKFGETWGKDYEKKMEKWGKDFGNQWGDEYAKKMEAWGKSLDAKLTEKYGEDYEKELEIRAERMAKKARESSTLFNDRNNQKIQKTIKIKMPKDAKLKVNVRHGELKFVSNISNLKADLSHSKLVANSIDGSSTSINASYTQVKVNDWIDGDLKLNYVENANLKNVSRLVLTSNSSDININSLSGHALIDGSFGELVINKIDDSFNSLNIILENSEATIALPETDYDLLFRGNRSKFNNESTPKKVIKNYPEGSSSNRTIVVNAKYSNVIMQ
jgi:hypothetical protein